MIQDIIKYSVIAYKLYQNPDINSILYMTVNTTITGCKKIYRNIVYKDRCKKILYDDWILI